MDLNLYDCPNCNTSGVLPTTDGLCPNCKKAIDLNKDKHAKADIEAKETTIEAKEATTEAEETLKDEVLVECKNHKGIQAIDKCTECWEVFCADCLIEIQGERYCHRCNAMMIQENVTIACKEASDALKFAIVGVLIIGIILEPIAISKALRAKKIINDDPRLTDLGKANAALIIGIIYLLLLILFILALNFRTF